MHFLERSDSKNLFWMCLKEALAHSLEVQVQLIIRHVTPDTTRELLETTFLQPVGGAVTTALKCDPQSLLTLRHRFWSFRSRSLPTIDLVRRNRVKVGNACLHIRRRRRALGKTDQRHYASLRYGEVKNMRSIVAASFTTVCHFLPAHCNIF